MRKTCDTLHFDFSSWYDDIWWKWHHCIISKDDSEWLWIYFIYETEGFMPRGIPNNSWTEVQNCL